MPRPLPTFAELSSYRAFFFDLDGVLTPTAEVHQRAWADMFTSFFKAYSARTRTLIEPYTDADYFAHLDGRRRNDGIQSVLASRGITLPFDSHDPAWSGDSSVDSPEDDTIVGLGLRKNAQFLETLAQGMQPYPGSKAFLDAFSAPGHHVLIAVVSSSKNAQAVLKAAHLDGYMRDVVDGVVAEREHLGGKPAPDTYVYAAKKWGCDPSECVVFEDATSGVAAGRAGGFGLVVGINRGAGEQELLDAGADIVVDDLADLLP